MALPTLDATFASAADLPRRQMLAKWLVEELGSGSIADYWTLPERYLWAKIAVAAGAPRPEEDYISLPKNYVWSDIYNAVSGSSLGTIDWSEKQALGHIAAAYRGDTANPEALATYIDWPWRYQVASIIDATSLDSDARAFIELSGATDEASIDAFVKGVKDLGLWDSMVAWPLRSTQNAGTGTTAYSLGGLGTYNGTLVNGPTWGADGINFVAASNTHITTPFTVGPTPKLTLWSVGSSSATSGAIISAWGATLQTAFLISRKLASGRYQYLVRSGGTTRTVSGTNTSISGFASIGLGTQGANTLGTVNGVLDGTIGFLPDESGTQAVNIGIQTTPTFLTHNGTISFALAYVAGDGMTTAQQLSLHNLYKQTLGEGLGLP